MSYEQRDNSGSVFKNRDKKTDKHPSERGKAMIDGVMYYVDCWTKQDKNGNPWYSLSFKKVEQAAEAPKKPTEFGATSRNAIADDDDSIPF